MLLMYVSSKQLKKLPILHHNHKALQSVDSFKYLCIIISRIGKLTEGLILASYILNRILILPLVIRSHIDLGMKLQHFYLFFVGG